MTGFKVDPLGLAVRTMDGHNVILLEDLPFACQDGSLIVGRKGSDITRVFHRPGILQADGASTPGILWSVGLPPFGWYWLAVLLHDLLYRMMTKPVIADREECDAILLEALRGLWSLAQKLGVTDYERVTELIYHAVSLAGEAAFLDDRTQRA